MSRRRDQSRDRHRRGKSVKPVHEPSVTGDQDARILDAKVTLHPGFEQIAPLRDQSGQKTKTK